MSNIENLTSSLHQPDKDDIVSHPEQQIDDILTQHRSELHNEAVRTVYEALKWYAGLLRYSLEVQTNQAYKYTDEQRLNLSIMQLITDKPYAIDNLLVALEDACHSLSSEIAGNDMGYEVRKLGQLDHAAKVLADLSNRVHSHTLVAGDVTWDNFLIINRAVELLLPLNNRPERGLHPLTYLYEMKRKYSGAREATYLDLMNDLAGVLVGERPFEKERRDIRYLARKLVSFLDSELSTAGLNANDPTNWTDESKAVRQVRMFIEDFANNIGKNKSPEADYLQNSYLTLTNLGSFFGVDDYAGRYLIGLYKRGQPA